MLWPVNWSSIFLLVTIIAAFISICTGRNRNPACWSCQLQATVPLWNIVRVPNCSTHILTFSSVGLLKLSVSQVRHWVAAKKYHDDHEYTFDLFLCLDFSVMLFGFLCITWRVCCFARLCIVLPCFAPSGIIHPQYPAMRASLSIYQPKCPLFLFVGHNLLLHNGKLIVRWWVWTSTQCNAA